LRHICFQPAEARGWPEVKKKKEGWNLHTPPYYRCSNVYVFIYKNNIHGQVILDFSSEKNGMKESPIPQTVQLGRGTTVTEMSIQLKSIFKRTGCPALLPMAFELSSDED